MRISFNRIKKDVESYLKKIYSKREMLFKRKGLYIDSELVWQFDDMEEFLEHMKKIKKDKDYEYIIKEFNKMFVQTIRYRKFLKGRRYINGTYT
jgi:hypothetical protein